MKKRIDYIDVAKGLLILCLCFCHYPHAIMHIGLHDEATRTVVAWHWVFSTFFMQAFFFITGYCTNFNKPARAFISKSIKTLAVPAVFFTIIDRLLLAVMFCSNQDEIYFELFHGVGFWFLWVLLFCRIIYYFMEKGIKSAGIKFLLLIAMTVCGIMSHLHGIPNYGYHQLTLCCCIFLFFGHYTRKHESFNIVFNRGGNLSFDSLVCGNVSYSVFDSGGYSQRGFHERTACLSHNGYVRNIFCFECCL